MDKLMKLSAFILIALLILIPSYQTTTVKDQTPSQTNANEEITVERISQLLDSIEDGDVREDVTLEIISLLFDTLSSSPNQLNDKTTNQLKDFLLRFRENKNKTKEREEERGEEGVKQRQQQCISCKSIRSIIEIMCEQGYAIQTGTCVLCGFLKEYSEVMCSITGDSISFAASQPQPCLQCSSWLKSIQLLCKIPDRSFFDSDPTSTDDNNNSDNSDNNNNSDDVGKREERGRKLFSMPNWNMNCIPCNKIYTSYQLFCGDLMDFCDIATSLPSSTPSYLPTPSISSSSSPSQSFSPSPSSSYSPTPSISFSPSSSPAPPSPPSPSATPSQYYWYYYY